MDPCLLGFVLRNEVLFSLYLNDLSVLNNVISHKVALFICESNREVTVKTLFLKIKSISLSDVLYLSHKVNFTCATEKDDYVAMHITEKDDKGD